MKKLLSSILCLIFSVFCICTSFAADDTKQAEYTYIDFSESDEGESILSYFDMLGLQIATDNDGCITRGDAVADIVKALGLESAVTGVSEYSDYNEKAASIAHSLGLLSGNAPSEWSLNSYITLHQAAKIFVVALGYEIAITDETPYPYGYLRYASTLKLLDGTAISDGDAPLKSEDFIRILYNAMQTEVMEISHIESIDGNYSPDYKKGDTLESLFIDKNNYVIKQGILEGCYYSQAVEGTKCEANQIRIDGAYYKYDGENVKSSVGCSVDYVYSEKDNKIIGLRLNGNNEIHKILDGDELYSESGYLCIDLDDGKKEKIKLSDNLTYVYNNCILSSYTASDVAFSGKKITMIDNDDDSYVDIIFLNKSESVIVNYVKDDIIYFEYGTAGGKKSLDLSDTYDFALTVSDMEGNIKTLSDIKEDSAISVIISKNSEYIELIILGDEFEGTPVGYSSEDREVYIDNSSYDLADGLSLPNLGVNYRIRVNENNEIFYMKSTANQYFYMLGKANAQGLGSAKVQLSNNDGLISIYELSQKVNIDGTSYSSENAISHIATDTLCSVDFNSDNKVHKIEYIAEYGELADRIYRENESGFNDTDYAASRPFRFNENTSFFFIPENGDANEVISEFVMENDEKYTTQSFEYDKDTGFVKAVVVKIDTDQRTDTNLTYKSDMAIVSDVRQVLNNEGDGIYKLTMFTEGEEKTFYCGTYGDVTNTCKNLKVGDIVRYMTNYKGVIIRLAKYVACSELDTYYIDGRNTTDEQFFGPVMTLNKNALTNYSKYLCHEITVSPTMSYNDVISMRIFAETDNPSDHDSEFSDYYVYNKRTETVELASIDDVVSFDDAMENASKVYIARSQSDVRFFVIIKDK